MNTLIIKQFLTVWFVFSLVQTSAQTREKEVQNPERNPKVNSINKQMPNRISMNVTVPKQTQGATFGEKVKSETTPANSNTDDESLRGVVTGRVSWNLSKAKRETEQSAVSSVSSLSGGGSGAAAASYARSGRIINPNTPIVTSSLYVREGTPAGVTGGVVAARQDYQSVFFEGQENTCDDCVLKVSTNPYFTQNENVGDVPLGKGKLEKGVDEDCDGVEGLTVSIINEQTGSMVASVITQRCGDFFFENLPKAIYILKFEGTFIAKKSYEIEVAKNGTYDISGELLSANNKWDIKINTGLVENPNGGEKVNAGLHAAGGALAQGASLLGGALPGGAVISSAISKYSPGEPIPGIDVKLRKSSTENDMTSQTNDKGQFEFTGLSKGSYNMSSTISFNIEGSLLLHFWMSKKGYDYYKSKSDLNKQSNTVDEKGINENGLKKNDVENTVVTQEKKGLNAVNVKTAKVESDTNTTSNETKRKGWDGTIKGRGNVQGEAKKMDDSTLTNALTNALSQLDDFKTSFVDLEKTIGNNKRQSINANKIPVQISKVRNRINLLETSLKNLRILGKTSPALADMDSKLTEMNKDFSALTENLDQLGEQYNTISNVLKTKHDTVKNSVGNIR